MIRDFFIRNQRETNKLAKILAREIIKKSLKTETALTIGLEGELGSGKTTFIKAFAKGLGIKKRLTSPTFVLMKNYRNFYHIDCYRIKSYKDILGLDFQEIISNPKNIILIEWAEKVKKILPKDVIWIKFKIISEKEREIKIS
jgi:tRNA threonylcarbamoyladenosine biosynthesis protein TsaE